MRSQSAAQQVTVEYLMAPGNTNKETRMRYKLLDPDPRIPPQQPQESIAWEGEERAAPMRRDSGAIALSLVRVRMDCSGLERTLGKTQGRYRRLAGDTFRVQGLKGQMTASAL